MGPRDSGPVLRRPHPSPASLLGTPGEVDPGPQAGHDYLRQGVRTTLLVSRVPSTPLLRTGVGVGTSVGLGVPVHV